MVISDGDRYKVASQLRKLVIKNFGDCEICDCGDVEDVLGLVGYDGAWYESASVRRLADLIEPQPVNGETGRLACCNLMLKPTDGFLCSVCGERIEFVNAENLRNYRVNYCPNCGARVDA